MSDTQAETYPVDQITAGGSVADIMAGTFPGPTAITQQGVPKTFPVAGRPLIYERMARVLADCPAIGKDSKNTEQDFKFRGVDAILNGLNPVLARHEVFAVPEVLDRIQEEMERGKFKAIWTRIHLLVRYTFYTVDGSSVSATCWGEGLDNADKSTSKAMTMAIKTCLAQTFAIAAAGHEDADQTTPPERSTEDAPAPVVDWYAENGWKDQPEYEDSRDALRSSVQSLDPTKLAGWEAWKIKTGETGQKMSRARFDAACSALAAISAGADPATGEVAPVAPDSSPAAPQTPEVAPSDPKPAVAAQGEADDPHPQLSTDETQGGLTVAQVNQMDKRSLVAELSGLGLATNGALDELRLRLTVAIEEPF